MHGRLDPNLATPSTFAADLGAITLQGAAGISLARATNAGSIILIPSFMNTDVFKKKEVRQALQYAIDKDQLIKVVLRGEAVPMSSPFPKGVAGGYVDGLPQYAVGHVDRVSRIREHVGKLPGLAVCGAVFDGVGISACISSARAAATSVSTGLRL